MAQLSVAEKGMATTSEKYTIAHSNHVGLKFVALKSRICRRRLMLTTRPLTTAHIAASTHVPRIIKQDVGMTTGHNGGRHLSRCVLVDFLALPGNRSLHF
jgi:hypothetical protein